MYDFPGRLVAPPVVPDDITRVSEDISTFSRDLFTGIYFLLDNEKVVYVGQTLSISSRIYDHHKSSKKFNRFAWVRCKPELLNDWEGYYIGTFLPKYNGGIPPNSHFMAFKRLKRTVKQKTGTIIKNEFDLITKGIYRFSMTGKPDIYYYSVSETLEVFN